MEGFAARLALIAATATIASSALAQPVSQGSAFEVNGYATGDQVRPSVCVGDGGEFVVAFLDRDLSIPFYESGRDGSGSGVFARRFSSGGTAQAPDFAVNTYTTGHQGYVDVACSAAGSFIVAWSDWPSFDGGHNAFVARAYDDQGTAQTQPVTIAGDELIGGPAEQAAMCRGAGDTSVAVWVDGTNTLYGRRYDSVGAAAGTEFVILTNGPLTISQPVCCGSEAGFVVAWADYGGDLTAQRFSPAGELSGTELVVNTYTTGRRQDPALACNDDGRFVAVWDSNNGYTGITGQDGDGHGIFARPFAVNGTPIGTEFQVNSYTSGDQRYPAIAMAADGGFAVVWDSPQLGHGRRGIYAQAFAPAGARMGSELRVDDSGPHSNSSESIRAAVATAAGGALVVAWQNNKIDGDQNGITARRYTLPTIITTTTTAILTSTTAAPTSSIPVTTTTLSGTTTSIPVTTTTLFATTTSTPSPTTTLSVTTTSTPITTTTIVGNDGCGDPVAIVASSVAGEALITASDALFVLRTAVGLQSCPRCVCDVDDSDAISASDALIVLKTSVGQAVALSCPAC